MCDTGLAEMQIPSTKPQLMAQSQVTQDGPVRPRTWPQFLEKYSSFLCSLKAERISWILREAEDKVNTAKEKSDLESSLEVCSLEDSEQLHETVCEGRNTSGFLNSSNQ